MFEGARTSLIAAAVALVACSSEPKAAPAIEVAATVTASPAASVEPEFVVELSDRIVARGADSGRQRELFRGPVQTSFFDPELEVLWIHSETALCAVDLRRTTPAPVRIVEGLEPMPITITHASGKRRSSASSSTCVVTRALTLDWTRAPTLSFITGDEAEKARLAARTKLVGAAWLAAEIDRAPSPRVPPRREPGEGAPRPASTTKLPCNGEGPCGHGVTFASGATLLVTDYDMGDCVHLGCRLYDPKRDRFATPPIAKDWSTLEATPAGSCGPYAFTSDEKRLLTSDAVCTTNACVPVQGRALGWLNGEVRVGVDP